MAQHYNRYEFSHCWWERWSNFFHKLQENDIDGPFPRESIGSHNIVRVNLLANRSGQPRHIRFSELSPAWRRNYIDWTDVDRVRFPDTFMPCVDTGGNCASVCIRLRRLPCDEWSLNCVTRAQTKREHYS